MNDLLVEIFLRNLSDNNFNYSYLSLISLLTSTLNTVSLISSSTSHKLSFQRKLKLVHIYS